MNKRVEGALVCLILAWALGLRIWRLDQPMFRVDEAESTINALSVLQHGYPAGRYLGLPLYENTLTLAWPESPEYEFRDSSYSRKGLAIYHGWLPLYAMAGSLKAFGVAPDTPRAELAVRRSASDMARLTRAARAPAVLFGIIFLLLLFTMANEVHGKEAAWGALLAGAFAPGIVELARQARYYSLTTLLSTACCLLAWRVQRHGRWRDYLLAAGLYSLLFHTHVIAFLIACAALALLLPLAARRPGFLSRVLAFSAIVLAATLPWALLSGFLDQASRIPRAWPLLRFPEDLWAFLRLRSSISVLLIGGSLLFLLADLNGRALPGRLLAPFLSRRGELRFLIAWLIVAYLVFTLGAPAVSYSLDRMALPMLGPGVVLAASLVAAGARVFAANPPRLLSGLLLAAYLALFGNLDPLHLERARPRYKQETIEFLRRHPPNPGTRLYATPNFHLFLSVYTGLPVQSVAPVRKSFLDAYPGEILLIEVIPFRSPPSDVVRDSAAAAGVRLDESQAQKLAWLVTSRAVRERLQGSVAQVDPALDAEHIPQYLRALVDDQPRYTEAWIRNSDTSVTSFPAMFRGFSVRDWTMWWPIYFYRFVDPPGRMGEQANYAARLRSGRASVLASGVTIHQLPSLPRPATAAGPARGGSP